MSPIDGQAVRAVLLLHGQPGNAASWSPVVDRLASEYRVLAPDRPGYGDSALDARGLAANADWAAEMLREQGAAPATVVGHSWAGGVALQMAHRHPDVVRSLVLVGSVGTRDSVNRLDRWLASRGVGDALSLAALAGISVAGPWVRRAAERMPRSKHRHLAATWPDVPPVGGAVTRDWRTFMVEQRALLDELSVTDGLLGHIDVPTAVVAGEWDVVVPPQAASSLAAAIPEAKLYSLGGVGHFVVRDAPDALVGIIRETDGQAGR
jgi:pimeloyl-ACP methyl ester carboxylesterase